MLVGCYEMAPEATIRFVLNRKRVVVAKKDRLRVTCHQELRGKRSVKSPDGLLGLSRHIRVKFDRDPVRRSVKLAGADSSFPLTH